MDTGNLFTVKQLSEILGMPKRSVQRRLNREKCVKTVLQGNGGERYGYALSALPADVQEAIYNNKDTAGSPGAAAALLPALAPAVLAQVAERFAPAVGLPVMSLAEASGLTARAIPAAPQSTIQTYSIGANGGGRGNGDEIPGIPATFAACSQPPAPTWTPDTAVHESDLADPRIRRILAILRDADAPPRDWSKGRRKWIEAVAALHQCTFQAIYRWQAKYEKRGIAGIRHEKSTKGAPKVWTPEAIDWWVSLCAKREHRHMNRVDLYEILAIEARRRGWRIGDVSSSNWWFKKRWTPLMEAMQRGGLRALDNALPPILRDYSDLAPFQILVGDQHRFDLWVVDEETGEVYRPEGYLWQDLRTRIIYGAAVDRRYDAWLIGLALRLGIRCYGVFGSIYTDNGKPELSRYLTGILASMRSLGMEWEQTQDVPMDMLDADGEDIDPLYLEPGTHKKAIVKNAKAKVIEGTFHTLEQVMSSRLRLCGSTKRLGDDIHWQDVDHQEAQALAKAGRLLTSREFALAMYLACDYYNREKHHRGVHREWAGRPKPACTTPYDCLRACYEGGWRPRMVSPEAADLLFLARANRPHAVDRGRINFLNEIWEHEALIELEPRTRVDLRYNPMTQDELHVFQGGRYLCTAVPVERSSMLDQDLASRKIAEKRERRKRFAEEFKRMSAAPDFREYSRVPEAERVAALIGDDRRRRAIENKDTYRPLSQEELDREVAKLEQGLPLPAKAARPLPARPAYFLDELTRFEWVIEFLKAGGELTADDYAFKIRYLAGLTAGQREYYEFALEGCNG